MKWKTLAKRIWSEVRGFAWAVYAGFAITLVSGHGPRHWQWWAAYVPLGILVLVSRRQARDEIIEALGEFDI